MAAMKAGLVVYSQNCYGLQLQWLLVYVISSCLCSVLALPDGATAVFLIPTILFVLHPCLGRVWTGHHPYPAPCADPDGNCHPRSRQRPIPTPYPIPTPCYTDSLHAATTPYPDYNPHTDFLYGPGRGQSGEHRPPLQCQCHCSTAGERHLRPPYPTDRPTIGDPANGRGRQSHSQFPTDSCTRCRAACQYQRDGQRRAMGARRNTQRQ